MSASDTQTDTQTDRQIHADENNTSPKTKFLGEVKRNRPKTYMKKIINIYVRTLF